MTFEEYINNPLQSRIAATTREIYRVSYSNRLDAVLVRVNNHIDYKMYKDDKTGSYYLYIKVPSEVVKDFTYDVVIRFVRPNHDVDMDKNLQKYDVQFFSNDPSFAYNMAYTFKSHKMFIEDLAGRAEKLSLNTKPTVTNPNNQIFYVKSIYFAYLIAKQKGLFTKEKYVEKYDKKRLFDSIEDTQIKIDRRIELGKKADAEDKKNKKERKVKETLDKSRLGRSLNFQVSNPDFSAKAAGRELRAPKTGKVNFNKNKKV